MNTARTIFSLLLSGTFRRFPDIRFIFCHGGGLMPLLVHRIEGLAAWPGVGPERLMSLFPEGVETEFRRLYFECAQAYSPINFGAISGLVPTSNILFGTDYNRFPIEFSMRQLERLNLDPRVSNSIKRRNAEALFPRLKQI
jgi:predicted TIM-barrel fold metal-dependent hydrolase